MANYSYKYRPCYGYTGYLIEFVKGSKSNKLLSDLTIALKELNPVAEPLIDLWMNDEIVAPFKTKIGNIEVSKDIYDFAFIMGSEEVILKIHEILLIDINYESLPVNYNDYKLKKR